MLKDFVGTWKGHKGRGKNPSRKRREGESYQGVVVKTLRRGRGKKRLKKESKGNEEKLRV